jgi:aminoglycoside 6'-N-acetyltransferase
VNATAFGTTRYQFSIVSPYAIQSTKPASSTQKYAIETSRDERWTSIFRIWSPGEIAIRIPQAAAADPSTVSSMRPTSSLGDHPLAMAIRFRPMTRADLPLVHEWHQRPHIQEWWVERKTFEETAGHYLRTIEGDEPTDHYIALLDGEPFGLIQTYLISDYPDYAALIGEGEGTAGVDLYIADESLTGRGLGTEMLRAFVEEIVFARPETTVCVAGAERRNTRSVRAFEKAGFRPVREFLEDGEVHVLVRRERDPA